MVQMYTILGRQVGSHWLALATLGTTFGGAYLATRGGKDKAGKQGAGQTPPINATSKEEEAFITEFLKSAEEESKKAKQ